MDYKVIPCNGDLEEIKKIQKLNDKNGDDKFLGWLHRSSVILACEKGDCLYIKDEDRVIGFLVGNSRKDGRGKVYSICVDSDYRKFGLGKQLLTEFLKKNNSLILKVMLDNPVGVTFFETVGGIELRRETNKRGTVLIEYEFFEIGVKQKMEKQTEINSKDLEITKPGNANGISLQLQKVFESGEVRSLNSEEKEIIISKAEKAYGEFLDALGVDWRNDPNSNNTPRRVAKAYVNDLWKGRYETILDVTAFPSDGYKGIVLEKDIPLNSMCSHHHQNIIGKVHIAYIPGSDKLVVGLSKLNRVVELFGRRGAIQEQLTMAIHNAIDKIVPNNKGVMVIIHATHQCVSCRGVRHQGASMVTSEVSGVFSSSNDTAKQEVLELIKMSI